MGVLTEQESPRSASTYWAVLKKRLSEEGANQLLTNCKQLKMKSADGKMRLTDENISQTENPETFEDNQSVARRGGKIAGNARRELETEIGHSVISEKDATQINTVVTNLIEDVSKSTEEK